MTGRSGACPFAPPLQYLTSPQMMALEMLRCILNGITGNISSGFGEKMKNSHVTSSQDDKILESALLSHFYSKPMTQSLLNLLISRSPSPPPPHPHRPVVS
jgi:hypothetical protein